MGLLTDIIEQKVKQAHDDELSRKEKSRAADWYIFKDEDGKFSQEARQDAWDRFHGSLEKPAKNVSQRGFDILGRIKGALGIGQGQQQSGPAAAPAGPPAPDATSGTVPASTFPSAPAPAAPSAVDQLQSAAPVREETEGTTVQDSTFPENAPATPAPPIARLQQAAPSRTQVAQAQPKASGADVFKNYGKEAEERTLRIKEAEEKFRRDTRVEVEREKAKGRPVVLTSTNWETKDGQKVNGFSDKAGNFYDLEHNPVDMATVGKATGKTSTAAPRMLGSDYVNLNNAIQMAKPLEEGGMGDEFKDEHGKNIDLSKIPQGMVLQRVRLSNGDTIYGARQINDKVLPIGGKLYAINPSMVQTLPQGGGTELGVKTPASASTHEVQATDAAGNPIAQTLRSTRTPQAPGVAGRPAPGALPISAPVTAPTSVPRGAAPPQAAVPVAAPTPGARPLPGYASGQFNQALQRVTPVREAVTQLFGDPGHPEVKTLKDFASLGDKPESMTRVGTALNMIFGGMEDAAGGAHISAGVGPVGVSTGGVGSLLQNYFGVKPELAQQNSEIMAKAMNALTPEEREYVNASVAAVSTMIGLRSLTRAPASEGTMKALERDIPLWGKNTFTKRDFADKMQHLGLLIANGAKGSEAILEKQSPGLLKHVQTSTGEMEKLKKTEPVKAPDKKPPTVGLVKDGYKFKGGDPGDKSSWEKVK